MGQDFVLKGKTLDYAGLNFHGLDILAYFRLIGNNHKYWSGLNRDESFSVVRKAGLSSNFPSAIELTFLLVRIVFPSITTLRVGLVGFFLRGVGKHSFFLILVARAGSYFG